jgi:putative membrane protein
LALLTGFVLGSLNKIWPWKSTSEVLNRSTGLSEQMSQQFDYGTLSVAQRITQDFDSFKAVKEISILPDQYALINQGINAELIPAISMMVLGFIVLFSLEYLGRQNQST